MTTQGGAAAPNNARTAEPLSSDAVDYDRPWITDGAWITGVAGTLTILLLGLVFGSQQAHSTLMPGFDGPLEEQKRWVMLTALGIVAAVMYGVEVLRLWRFDAARFKRIDPHLLAGRQGAFVLDCVKRYLLLGLLFWLCRLGYHSLNEYGYRPNNTYYQPWFYTLEILWRVYLVAGLPYILLTRARQYDAAADRKDYARLTEKCLLSLIARLPRLGHLQPAFDGDDGRAARGLAVKFFFAPVMTIFFADNFFHLQNNLDYLTGTALPAMVGGSYDYAGLGRDMGNVFSTVIFTIDVGLAWCGYIISSRWVDNQTVSAEPTLLGWIVCLISYPPFRVIGGWLLSGPGEKLYTQMPYPNLVGIFGTMMLISYFFYMLPTIWFGLRFSNLTHRGILRRGPFAVVRHPAYAAKNFGWWCVGFPAAVYVGVTSSVEQGILYVLGLILLSTIYYARAITEERHLSFDPAYREYCRHVPYRFIPYVI